MNPSNESLYEKQDKTVLNIQLCSIHYFILSGKKGMKPMFGTVENMFGNQNFLNYFTLTFLISMEQLDEVIKYQVQKM